MDVPVLTPPPPAPQRSDTADVFVRRADAHVAWLSTNVSQTKEVVSWINETSQDIDQKAKAVGQQSTQVNQQSQTINTQFQRVDTQSKQVAQDAQQTKADRAQTGADRVQTSKDRELAEAARNQAQSIAAGNVAITDLQPGPVTSEGDFVTAGPDGRLIKRSLRDGSQRASLSSYDLKALETSSLIDLSAAQVYRIDATQGPVDLEVSALADPSQSITVILSVTGNNIINLSESIAWSENKVPEMGNSWTLLILFKDGARWMGGRSFYA